MESAGNHGETHMYTLLSYDSHTWVAESFKKSLDNAFLTPTIFLTVNK